MKRVELAIEGFPPVEVTISPVPFKPYFDFLERWSRDSMPLAEFRADVAKFVELAAPSTSDGTALEDLDFGHLRAVITEWARQVREVPLPLPAGPSGPPPSPEPSSVTPAAQSKRQRSSRGHA